MDPFHQRRAYQPFPASAETANDDVGATASGEPATDAPTDTPTHRDMSQDAATDDVTPVATPPVMSSDVVTQSQDLTRQTDDMTWHVDRKQYTLTVEDVAVRLADENIYRDPRTIQRWCQSGKLDCLLDTEHGDNSEKYFIEPTSLERMVATLIRDRDRKTPATSRQMSDMSRPAPRQQTPAPDDVAINAATDHDMSRHMSDTGRDDVASGTPSQEKDADLQSRIHQLETELAMAKADKQVREQMVDYLKEQFEQMLDGALDRSEQIGELRAENAQLKNLLGAGPSVQVDNVKSDPASEHVE